ncbi:LacI family DNA-binding transcriptional regulator [Paenibacillus xerothermodurans]|uniref:LacI family transcriptional regulator n=1 Tax=Paenibacillus xerothermodurans TaxID=1977292 RepID=A0A2W1NGM4_PAEXE|nr:LacI family DNA-binding transcriptional regulator [Paenibacillus xerothermodurans]PZE22840.1 LacI family transcriptional regulator [Paenibacillus xerothermodurans]
MTSIKDIAQRANVSTATVSYVLNGTGNISEKTRARILQVIEAMNYQPNHIAKSLKLKKTKTIGVVVEDVTSFNSAEIIDGINEYAEDHGFSLLLTNMRVLKRLGNERIDTEHVRQLAPSAIKEILSKKVDGLIYIGIHTRDVTGIIPDNALPTVYTYCYTTNERDFFVNYNDHLAAYEATTYLIRKGHRNIAVISGLFNSNPSRERFNGYYQAIMDNQLVFDPTIIKTGDWEFESGRRFTAELLGADEPPTAILAMNDIMAAGAMSACAEQGVRVPDDISIVGFDDREFSSYLNPKLTTMRLPLHEMGVEAMRSLTDLLSQSGDVEKDKKLQCTLIERNSVAPAKSC